MSPATAWSAFVELIASRSSLRGPTGKAMEISNVEAIYPLTPLQEAVLLEVPDSAGDGGGCEQWVCPLHGELDLDVLVWAWQQVGEQYPSLRTSFVWKRMERPVQVVHQRVELPLELQDWRGLSP